MGRLIYTQDSSYDIDDRILAHLRVVMMNKLRRREGFMLQMPTTGGGRSSIWISPTRALLMQFYGGRAPQLDRELIDKMMHDASSADGLTLSNLL